MGIQLTHERLKKVRLFCGMFAKRKKAHMVNATDEKSDPSDAKDESVTNGLSRLDAAQRRSNTNISDFPRRARTLCSNGPCSGSL
ncbi:MAG: hypothetical protein WA821_12120, partial [Anaerolineales bacterium]